MLAGMLLFGPASDFIYLFTAAIMALCSPWIRNGFVLGWIGVATRFSVIALVVYLFHLLAAGRLTGITASAERLLKRRWIAVTVLFGGAVALRMGVMVARMILAWRLGTSAAAGHAFQIGAYLNITGDLADVNGHPGRTDQARIRNKQNHHQHTLKTLSESERRKA
jgi:hypothetical protein